MSANLDAEVKVRFKKLADLINGVVGSNSLGDFQTAFAQLEDQCWEIYWILNLSSWDKEREKMEMGDTLTSKKEAKSILGEKSFFQTMMEKKEQKKAAEAEAKAKAAAEGGDKK